MFSFSSGLAVRLFALLRYTPCSLSSGLCTKFRFWRNKCIKFLNQAVMEILSINVKDAKSFPPWYDKNLKETEIDSGTAFEGLLL